MAIARKTTVTRMAARMWWLPLVPVGFLTDRSSRWRWFLMPGVVIFTALTSSVGKLAIRRPRPGSVYRVVPWRRLGAAGFPSTHSACAFAVAGWLRASRHGRWLHAVAVLIGCSRVRCRAHHSTDVAAGAILGYAIAWQLDKVWSRLRAGGMPGSTKPAPGKAVVSGKESRSLTPEGRIGGPGTGVKSEGSPRARTACRGVADYTPGVTRALVSVPEPEVVAGPNCVNRYEPKISRKLPV